MKQILITLTALIALTACGGSQKTASSMPAAHIPDGSKAVLEVFFDSNARPGMSREAKHPLTSAVMALDALKQIFSEFKDRVECYTTVKDHFVFSIRPEKSEGDPGVAACSYTLIIYAKHNEKLMRYYWLLRQ
ncbi:hypothetical protein KKF84_00220 [Myxococcota bacterium]|nr:hypothetical protein [Myxococcota bacterium]MBU1533708.1 hypothetical protein [Myxococcota bacterium]